MEYRQLGATGVRVSELCLGTMTFGREADEAAACAIVDRFFEAGGNFVDTANNYGDPPGRSESILGDVLSGRRDQVVLATKVRFATGDGVNDRGLSRRHIRLQCDASLRRLGTDWIDLYQVHSWDPTCPLEETLSALDDLVRDGKVRYVGASNFAGWQLAKALGVAAVHGWEPFVSLQPTYSLVTRDIERELLPLCRADGIAVMPYGPLAGGLLSGKYHQDEAPAPDTRAGGDEITRRGMAFRMTEHGFSIARVVETVADAAGRTPSQVALNWVLTRAGVTAPILGVRTTEQLDDNLGAVGWRLDPEHEALLDEASRITLGYPHNFHTWMAELGI
ncbi:MAG TPA: aldo/keto reductase [Acidimicrobiia bacterium]|jgi:aryl-alcohol dehydrogenase-like predicted oxidoreductase